MDSVRDKVKALAEEYAERGDALGWFEELYRLADGEPDAIPWADMAPNPNLVEWLGRQEVSGNDRRALVVGCGLGDDAEELARRGFAATAFDVSPTAIAWCRRRFPDSNVAYLVADLYDLPVSWAESFDFVLEIYTLQVLPPDLQARAMPILARCVAPGGTLLAIARGRDDDDPHGGGLHWRLSHADLAGFVKAGPREAAFEDYLDQEDPPVRRFRVEYRA